MKYIPNNSLLTEQNRIVQLYLVSFLFKYFILRLIQQKQYKDFELTEKSNSCCYFKAQPSTRLWQTRCGHWTRRRWCFENQWTLNDFGIGIKAWGGSYLALGGAVALGGMMNSAAISATNTAIYNAPLFLQTTGPTLTGFFTGGLHKANMHSLNWDQPEAEGRAMRYGELHARFAITTIIGGKLLMSTTLFANPLINEISKILAPQLINFVEGSRGSVFSERSEEGPIADLGIRNFAIPKGLVVNFF